jgi:hypothetical protein
MKKALCAHMNNKRKMKKTKKQNKTKKENHVCKHYPVRIEEVSRGVHSANRSSEDAERLIFSKLAYSATFKKHIYF